MTSEIRSIFIFFRTARTILTNALLGAQEMRARMSGNLSVSSKTAQFREMYVHIACFIVIKCAARKYARYKIARLNISLAWEFNAESICPR